MILVVEPLDPDVMQWLVARHAVRYAPDLARSSRMAAAWFDSLEPGLAAPGRPLHGIDTLQVTLQVTSRVASTIRESRVRAAWDVARQIDSLLTPTSETPAR